MILPESRYACIVVDPPRPHRLTGAYSERENRAEDLPYQTLTLEEISNLTISNLARPGCHLWLWATNSTLHDAFHVMEAWGFTYLNLITWTKPSGMGAYFANTTQHCLFGYYQKCQFPLRRWLPTHFYSNSVVNGHSTKPGVFYNMVRQISPEPRLDLFNRRQIEGFEGWGMRSVKIKIG